MNYTIITNRKELQDAIADIHPIQRFLICAMNRKKHKLAYAYSLVAADLLYQDHPSTTEMWNKSDKMWAELYGINYQPKA